MSTILGAIQFIQFANNPTDLDCALLLDDSVFWGALPMMAEAKDNLIERHAKALMTRNLPKCIDIRKLIEVADPVKSGMSQEDRQEREARVKVKCKSVAKNVSNAKLPNDFQVFVDESNRNPYKKFQDSQSMLNQILIRQGDGSYVDMAHLSPVVSSAETFEVCRAYHFSDDKEGESMIKEQIRNIVEESND